MKGKKPKMIRDKFEIFGHILKKEIKQKKGKKKHKERIIKGRIIRDIKTRFEEVKDCYEPKRVSNFWNNNYTEHGTNGDKNRNLSLDKYLNKIQPYLKNIINNLQNSDAWKIQLIIAINFISSKHVEEDRAMHSASDYIKFTPYGNATRTTNL